MPGCATSGGGATRTSSSTYACKCALRMSIRRAFRATCLRPFARPRRRVAKSDSNNRRASKGGVAANMESSL
eukprot:4607779-Alexandrium_andersonii.AAC.1